MQPLSLSDRAGLVRPTPPGGRLSSRCLKLLASQYLYTHHLYSQYIYCEYRVPLTMSTFISLPLYVPLSYYLYSVPSVPILSPILSVPLLSVTIPSVTIPSVPILSVSILAYTCTLSTLQYSHHSTLSTYGTVLTLLYLHYGAYITVLCCEITAP